MISTVYFGLLSDSQFYQKFQRQQRSVLRTKSFKGSPPYAQPNTTLKSWPITNHQEKLPDEKIQSDCCYSISQLNQSHLQFPSLIHKLTTHSLRIPSNKTSQNYTQLAGFHIWNSLPTMLPAVPES